MRRRLLALVVAPLLLAALSGCGYSLAGRGSALPAHIKNIGIPLFANATSVFDVEQTMTQKVRLEFIGRGRYKVTPDDTGADAVLKGEITGISIRPTAFTDQQQASRYEITVTVKVEFRDIANDKVLYENPAQTFKDEYEVTTGQSASDTASFLGQNSNALDRLSTDFAKAVVTSVLEAF